MVYNGTIIVCGSPDAVGLAYAILHLIDWLKLLLPNWMTHA